MIRLDEIQSVVLKRRLVRVCAQLPELALSERDFSTVFDLQAQALRMEVRKAVFGRKLSEVSVSYPADWWQAVKDRWFPAWAKKRWPVQMKTERLVSTEEYTKISAPDEASFVRLFKNPEPSSVYEDHE